MTEAVKSKNVSLKVIELKSGEKIKLKTINLDMRCAINDKLFEIQDKPNFSTWVWLLREVTGMTDEQINNLTTEEIVEASTKIVEVVNGKK